MDYFETQDRYLCVLAVALHAADEGTIISEVSN
jgi:hypothetical protein